MNLFKRIRNSRIFYIWGFWFLTQSKVFYILNSLKISWEIFRSNDHYREWLKKHNISSESLVNSTITGKTPSALVNIIILVEKINYSGLKDTIHSVMEQSDSHWKIFLFFPQELETGIKSDPGISPSFPAYGYQDTYSLIKTINKLIFDATGDFVTFVKSGDLLKPGALSEVTQYFQQSDPIDVVYTDEDVIGVHKRLESPAYKPGWSPDFLLTHPYLGRLTVYRNELLTHLGGLNSLPFLASEFDLILRIAQNHRPIKHLPMVLYSRSYLNPDNHPVQKEVLVKVIQQVEPSAKVEPVSDLTNFYRIHWPQKDNPLISIIILTRDKPNYLSKCLSSIFDKTLYPNFEIILIDNGSCEERTKDLFKIWETKEPSRFHCYSADIPFNFSALNNLGVTYAKGELILFLNNDTVVISPDWLNELVGQTQQPSVGAVSAMLLYPNKTVQHAGIVVGGPNVAVHCHYRYPVHFLGYMGRLLVASNFSAVTAACMMVRKDLFLGQGGFDEQLAVSYNDVEFCLRLSQAGYYHVVLPYVRLYHHESISRGFEDTAEKSARLAAEKKYILNRWPDRLQRDDFFQPNPLNFRNLFPKDKVTQR